MRTRIAVTLVVAAALALAAGAGAVAGADKKPPHPATPHIKKTKVDTGALFAVLTGRNEVDANGHRGAGDPDGHGSFTAIVDDGQLCFGITVANLDQPTAAHIHSARRNQNGAVVVPLTQPTAGDPGASSGCVTIDPTLAQAILKNPHKYYANVHTTAFPNGAVRGQLGRKSH